MTIAGVNSVDVNFESGKTVIESTRQIDKQEINKALEGTDYAQKD